MPRQVNYTYKHPSLDHRSWIDWFLVSDSLRDSIVNFDILDDPLNLSDHLPVELELKLAIADPTLNVHSAEMIHDECTLDRVKLRWDKAALDS